MFDYVDGGADDEVTMAANVAAWREVTFRPRLPRGPGVPDTATVVLGTRLSLPVILGPAGLVRAMHPDGAAGVARAAAGAGTVSVLSAVAGSSLEEVASATEGPMWFQLYSPGGPAQSKELVARAADAGYEALVVTVDTAALGNRERDVAHGVAPSVRMTARAALGLGAQVAVRPRWLFGMAASELRGRAARRGRADLAGATSGGGPSARRVAVEASPFSWNDVADVRRQWAGHLVVKGVLTAGEARRAVDAGADAVVVSNHGGRQLDGDPATMRVLPAVAEAVARTSVVMVDGGVRRGSDVVKALAAGADAVLVGRAFLYGLGAAGEAGVARVLEILRSETLRTLTLLGCPSVEALDRSWIDLPQSAASPPGASPAGGRDPDA